MAVVVLPLSNRLNLVSDAQLLEDAAAHVMHCGFADPDLRRDLFIGKSFSHVFHQSVFAGRERPATQTTMPGTFATGWWWRDLGFPTWDEK